MCNVTVISIVGCPIYQSELCGSLGVAATCVWVATAGTGRNCWCRSILWGQSWAAWSRHVPQGLQWRPCMQILHYPLQRAGFFRRIYSPQVVGWGNLWQHCFCPGERRGCGELFSTWEMRLEWTWVISCSEVPCARSSSWLLWRWDVESVASHFCVLKHSFLFHY